MAFGLKPVRYKDGSPYNGAANVYYVPASDGTALFVGDPVIIAGSGDADGVPSVTRAAAGVRVTGAVVGFTGNPNVSTDTGLRVGYRAASTEDYVLVADSPDLLFEVNEDAVGGALAVTDIGLNLDLVAAAGSTVTKKSGYALDSSTKATTAAQVRLQGKSPTVDNAIGSTSTVWLVTLVESTDLTDGVNTGI